MRGAEGSRRPTLDAPRYLYAIIAGAAEAPGTITGIDGKPLEFVVGRQVTAAVTPIEQPRIRPERRYLASHHEVLAQLMASESAILPVRFGTIAQGRKEIRAMLARNQAAFARQLKRVAGRVEMGLRVAWDVPNIFSYFVGTIPDLREARDRVFGRNGQSSREEQIELGRLFERLLEERRAAHTSAVEFVVSPCCVEIKRNALRNEQEVMNLACLIDRNCREAFEAAVLEAARQFNNNFAFDYSGPWPPHSFAEWHPSADP